MNIERMREILAKVGVSEDTIRVVTLINGYTEKTLTDILRVETHYDDFEQYAHDYAERCGYCFEITEGVQYHDCI